MKRALPLIVALPLLIGGASLPATAPRSVADATADSAAADSRSDDLRLQSERAERTVALTAARRRTLERQIAGAEADIAAARLRLEAIARSSAAAERRLAIARGPLMRLGGALERFSRQPAGTALLRPGTLDDLVHVRAILDSTLPRIERRTLAARTALRRTAALRIARAAELEAITRASAGLEDRRRQLALSEIEQSRAAQLLQTGAVRERSRALALGEEARDIVATERQDRAAGAVLATLSALPPPPVRGAPTKGAGRSPYRLPVAGTVLTGFGEASSSGYRARGVTIAALPGAEVTAPAAGVVRFAGHYRSYGDIVIIDHGNGWTSLLTGLARTGVSPGSRLRAGEPLGSVAGPLTLELRRRGRPVDVAAML